MSKIFKIAFVVMAIAAMAAPGIVTDAYALGGNTAVKSIGK